MLLSEDGLVKLFYSPLAAQLGFTYSIGGGYHNDSWYTVPDKAKGHSELKSDVWSLGVSLLEMVRRENPSEGCDEERLRRLLSCFDECLEEHGPSAFVDFVEKCVAWDVKKRWSVSELMEVSECVGIDE